MHERPIVYIAGPYRAPGWPWGLRWLGVWLNVRRAAAWTAELAARGWAPICPHTNSYWPSKINPKSDEAVWLACALALLAKADAVFLLPAWNKSAGTRREVQLAAALHIHAFTHRDKMPAAKDFWEWSWERNQEEHG